jgi:hypothetical protein
VTQQKSGTAEVDVLPTLSVALPVKIKEAPIKSTSDHYTRQSGSFFTSPLLGKSRLAFTIATSPLEPNAVAQMSPS